MGKRQIACQKWTKDMSRQLREKMQMASKHVMSHSICLASRKMQIKKYFLPSLLSKNVKTDNSK